MRFLALLALVFCGCSSQKDEPKNPQYPVVESEATQRFLGMLDEGWVVSRWDDGRIEHAGDSLIFTGIGMAALGCADGAPLAAALQKMLQETGGRLYRHPTLKDEWSLDGALGFYYGVQARTARCGEKDTWGPLLKAHAASQALPPFFDVARQALMSDLGLNDPPSDEARGTLGAELDGWAVAVVSQRAAAYRLHLAWITFELLHRPPKSWAGFCGAVQKAQMPLLEHECGRGTLAAWAEKFEYDRWEYALQRAAWETETVASGLHTPGLDYLIARRLLSQQ